MHYQQLSFLHTLLLVRQYFLRGFVFYSQPLLLIPEVTSCELRAGKSVIDIQPIRVRNRLSVKRKLIENQNRIQQIRLRTTFE